MALLLLLACVLCSDVGAFDVVTSPLQELQHSDVARPLFETFTEYFLRDSERMLDLVDRFIDEVRLSAANANMKISIPDDVLTAVKNLKKLGRQANRPAEQKKALDETSCEMCKLVLDFLKRMLELFGFDRLLWPIIQVCYWLDERGSNPLPELQRQHICNGSVTIQGPHIAYILNSSKVSRICQLQNACWNPIATPRRQAAESISASSSARRNEAAMPLSQQPKAKAVITVAQLTDIHIDIRYLQGQLTDCQLPICCSDAYGPGSSGPFGDYKCNIPPRTIEVFIRKAAELNPDVILYSGDVSGSRLWDESLDELLDISRALTSAITKNVGDHRVYPCFGNHEVFPTNLYYKGSPEIVTLNSQLTDWWTPIAGFNDEQRQTMNYGAYYSILVAPGLRLIQYNSNYMYTKNFYNVLNFDERDEAQTMVTFVESELQAARSNGEKVILMGHHPTNSGDYFIDLAYWYRDLVLTYSDIIVLQIAGHRHCDSFNLIQDNVGQAASMIYLAPPVSAGGTKNPSMRVYKLDSETFEVVDYDQYYLDLKTTYDLSATDEPEIVKLYSAKDEYQLPDLSPSSWNSLVDRMETDSDLLLQHYRHFYIDSRDNLQCDANCQRSHLCNLRNWAYDGYYGCVNGVYVHPAAADADASETTPDLGLTSAGSSITNTDNTISSQTTSHHPAESTTTSRATQTHLSSNGLFILILLVSLIVSIAHC